jgi:uncharacterized protein (DUF885 family)
MAIRWRRLGIALWAAACALPGAPARAQTAPDTLERIVADYQAIEDRADPDASPTWPDVSPQALADNDAARTAIAARLAALAAAGLGEEEALTRTLILARIADAHAALGFDEARIPFIKNDGFFTVPSYAAGHVVLRTPAQARAWIARLHALPRFYAQNIANMRRGIATGFTQPAIVGDSIVPMIARLHDFTPATDPLLKPFAKVPPGVAPAEWAGLKAEALGVVQREVHPAQAALLAFVRDEYRPHARAGLGAGTLPGGAAYYAFVVRHHTTTDLTPDQIFAIGQSEVRRIRAKMEAAKAQSGFKGDMKTFLAMLRTDRRFYAPDLATYVDKVSEIAKRIDWQVPHVVGTLPRLTYGVIVQPPEIEGSSNGYLEGDPVAGVAGQVSVHRASTGDPLFALPAWVLHEGVPGHHLQIARAQELTGLPAFRRKSDITAFVEGWGLYSETLGEEMGIYRTPYERFGKLTWEVWRACRLQMDVGLHLKGWTFDHAANCLRENTALPEYFIRDETLRYIAWPGQALAYKVGELELLRLRRKAEAGLGARFDVRAFHDLVLGSGALPLDVLALRVDGWIARGGPAAASAPHR